MKKILVILTLLLSGATLYAAPIGEQRARQIAEEFFMLNTTRSASNINLEWAGDVITEPISSGDKLNSALMYIYNQGENNGFVIIAGDDTMNPIIAYSFDSSFDKRNMADATEAILDAWCKEISQARKTEKPISGCSLAFTRAEELIYDTAIWNQTEPYNREAPVYDGYRCYTGCVATALSIICYYNRWPEKGVGTTPEYFYTDYYDVSRVVAANQLGRTYDYDNMLSDYNGYYNNSQGNAVAALMKDIGTAVQMHYHYSGSGAYDTDAIAGITKYFGYNKGAKLMFRNGYSNEEWNSMLRQNLKSCGPTYYSGLNSDGGGHAFVVDGYNGDYFHFNFGWGGSNNGYFLTPNITYYLDQVSIFNLTPDKSGDSQYKDNLLLCSATDVNGDIALRGLLSDATEYVCGEQNEYALGGFLNFGSRPFNGTIKLVHCTKEGTWKEELYTYNISNLSVLGFGYCETFEMLTINESIEEGDRLRIYYKSDDSNEWEWARRYDDEAVNEILLYATPAEVAETLSLHYDKSKGMIYLESPHALQIDINYGVNSGAVKSHSTVGIETSKGEHIFSISSGGDPYILKIKL